MKKFRHASMKPGTDISGALAGAAEELAEKVHDEHDHHHHKKHKKKKYKKVSKWLQRAVWVWAIFCSFYALVKLGPEGFLPAPYVQFFDGWLDVLQDKAKDFLLEPAEHLLVASSKAASAALGYADKNLFIAPSPDQLHILAGSLYFMCAPWQLLPGLRRYSSLHRWTERFYLVANIGLALSGLRLVTTDTIDVTSGIIAVLSLWSAVSGVFAFITKTDSDSHKMWVVRNLLSGIAIFSLRNVGILLLAGQHFFVKTTLGITVGPIYPERAALFLGAVFWGVFITHLIVIELYLTYAFGKPAARPTAFVRAPAVPATATVAKPAERTAAQADE